MQRKTVGDENKMMTKTTIALAAALFLAAGAAAQADDPDSHLRQSEGFSFHTGPLGQPLGERQPGSQWAAPSRAYDSVPKHEYIRQHHRPPTCVRAWDFPCNRAHGGPPRAEPTIPHQGMNTSGTIVLPPAWDFPCNRAHCGPP
jgi:hypothetical protein